MKIYACRIEDSHGQVCEVVGGEMADIVHVCGLNEVDGTALSFESEMYRLGPWASENDLDACLYSVEIDLMNLTADKWCVSYGMGAL